MPSKPKEIPPDRRVPKIMMTYDEAAWSSGLSLTKLYKMVSEGKLPVIEIGGNTLIDPEDLNELKRSFKKVRNQ